MDDVENPSAVGTRLRILLIAELANPEWVSGPLIGWATFEALSKVAEVHLATQVRNEENIRKTGLSDERFTIIDNRSVERPALRMADFLRGDKGVGGVGQTLVTAFSTLAYYRFEQLLWQKLGARIRAHEFDVVHRLTPVSPAIPSIIGSRCVEAGVPFVLGPINGGLPWPKEFTKDRLREREWLSYVRGLYRLMPYYGSTRRNAAAIITGSRATLEQVADKYRPKCVYLPENAVAPERFDGPAVGPVILPLRIAFVGRLVPYKMPGLMLDAALPFIQQGLARLDYYGDGPEMAALRSKVAAAGVEDKVNFAGWVQHTDLKHRLAEAHVLGFPSIREFGGAVVLEAMAMGLVPLVVDYGGPGELVSPSTGFAVPMGPPEQLAASIRKALEHLIAHPEEIRPMGSRARLRVMRTFTWAAKAGQLLEIYRWVLGCRGKPDFGTPLND